MKGTQRKTTQKKHIEGRKMRGSREVERIPSKARSNASVQSIASATESEETDGTEQEKAKEREQRSQTDSIGSLLRRRHSVGRRRIYSVESPRSNAATQSVASSTKLEESDETEEEKAKEREQRSQMHSIRRLL